MDVSGALQLLDHLAQPGLVLGAEPEGAGDLALADLAGRFADELEKLFFGGEGDRLFHVPLLISVVGRDRDRQTLERSRGLLYRQEAKKPSSRPMFSLR
jgi:hypothetical protein